MIDKPAFQIIGIVFVLFCGLLAPINAAPGDLDTTFAGTGFVRDASNKGSSDRINATAIQADGKIVAVGPVDFGLTNTGTAVVCAVTRYNTDGSLDVSFDGDGKTIVQTGVAFRCNDVAVQADGKIVVVGYVQIDSIYNFALFRYNPDGTPDTSFDGDGRKTSAFINADFAYAVAIQTDGKLVVCGNIGDEFAVARYNSDGSLDGTFDGDGWVATDFFGGPDHSRAIAIQPDGKIVVAGNGRDTSLNEFAVARYHPDGSLDNSFSGDGKVLTDLQGHNDNVEDVVIQTDGKIVIGGNSWASNNDFGLARYNADGSLDTSFDGDGKWTANVWINDYLADLSIQADGKILVAGGGTTNISTFFGFIRLNPNGSFDNSFDGDGRLLVAASGGSSSADALAIQPDGKILAAGISSVSLSLSGADFALVRLNTDGSIDTSFDGDGKVATNIRSWRITAHAAAVQPDGKIVAAGRGQNGNSEDFTLYRYHPDGTPDTSFGTNGKALITVFNAEQTALAIAFQSDGKIIVAGKAHQEAAIVRLLPNGVFDGSFSGDGIIKESCGNADCYTTSLSVQPDGKILAGGRSYVAFGPGWDFTIFRYHPNGTRDASFDGDGKATTDFSGTYALKDGITSMALLPDGKIVAAGVAGEGTNGNFAVARYLPDGSLDVSFDGDGKTTTDFTGGNDYANGLAVQTDGKIVLAGYSSNDTALVRYNTDGTIDTSFDGDGRIRLAVSNFIDTATDVAIQPDDRIVTAGYALNAFSNDLVPSNKDFVLLRFNSNGSIDNTYGAGGKAFVDLSLFDEANAVALDSSGRAVIAGESDGLFTVARLLGGAAPSGVKSPFDFDGDGKTDLSIFRPAAGEWWYLRSSDGGNFAARFGASTDHLTPADFTGDGKTDIAFFRPASGEWYVLRSEDQSYYSFPFGSAGDIPAAGDFDLDGKADAAVFRPATGTWYVNLSTGGAIINHFGQTDDVPVLADYDGDGKADMGIYRVASGEWWIQRSTNGLIAFQFGNSTDKPVQGDYTGDGKTDAAFFRPSTGEWFVLRSENLSYYSVPFGTSGDMPTPGDYDGDGKFDPAVFRPSNLNWYINRTTSGLLIQQFGQGGDKPVPSAFVP